ncbi:RidA family protein [Pseudokordiimonas caeni]|uniref:RidA family protein n=1 Tax=Pseudokordiimonas caeni TaxID=2997908 RepID=UPI002810A774|nr:RidA family protein [Pseudokordiimonas caeni]
MSVFDNPYAGDPDRAAIWDILVRKDIDAFLDADWSQTEPDFVPSGFFGIDGQQSDNPDGWAVTFPNIHTYKAEWLKQAAITARTCRRDEVREPLFAASRLKAITINGDGALAHKEIKGAYPLADGTKGLMDWQSVYVMRKVDGAWKIASFVGYLPSMMGAPVKAIEAPAASQHVTAGPYSPVLRVKGGEIVVISGQAAIDPSGAIVGASIEDQTRYTLENCRAQLQNAGLDLTDVFKVNVYLTNIDEWSRFNSVYREFMREPYPARTAIQAVLIPGLIVEIDMWAAKK